MSKRAIIVGAGIGGLTAAHALAQAGWAPHVYEQAQTFENLGAGIQLSPNATRILDRLGLLAKIEAAAVEPEAATLRDGQRGTVLMRAPLKGFCRRVYGAPYLHISRPVLHALLAEGVRVRMGHRVEAYVADQFTVAADGLHSALQTQMNGPERPRFTGQVAWRGTVAADADLRARIPADACVWVGPGQHLVTYYPEPGTLNFVGVTEQKDWQGEGWNLPGNLAEMRARFARWHPSVQGVLASATDVRRWALFDRPALPRWIEGQVALLGDAAHPTLPFLAQGAALAIEDAWILAQTAPDLGTYERRRKSRATRLQAWARSNANLYHQRRWLDYVKLGVSRHVFRGPQAHALLWSIFRA